MMVADPQASKKRIPNPNEQILIDYASKIRAKSIQTHEEIQAALNKAIKERGRPVRGRLGDEFLQATLQELFTAMAEDGEAGFMAVWETLERDNRVKPEWRPLLDTPAPTGDTPPEEVVTDKRLRLGKKGKPVFRTMTEDDIDLLPVPACLIGGLVHEISVSLFYGFANVGKTFLLIHLAQCVARGKPFFGRKVKQGKVLYIYAEGGHGMKLRLRAWRKHYDNSTTKNIEYISVPTHLIHDKETILDTVDEWDESPSLVIIDTYSMCTSGSDQKDQKDVNIALATAREVSNTFNCHVAIVHHSNKADDFNGAAEFKNNVDTMVKLQVTNQENKQVLMTCMKQRDMAYFEDMRLKLVPIDLGMDPTTQEFMSSCIYQVDESPNQAENKDNQDKAKMLTILQQNGKQSTSKWRATCSQAGIPERTFDRLTDVLSKEGKVIVHEPARNGLAKEWEVI